MSRPGSPARTGGCLCGEVRYEVRGPLRDVLFCHCRECLRWHGHVCAAAAADQTDVVIVHARCLRWIDSPGSDAHARRGFCAQCGTSLFWEAPDRPTISISAGTLDDVSGLAPAAHIYVSQAPSYDVLPDDGLPRYPRAYDG
jgi:hypothetical protein